MEPYRPVLVIDTSTKKPPTIEEFRAELLRQGLDPDPWLALTSPSTSDTVDLVVSSTHGRR